MILHNGVEPNQESLIISAPAIRIPIVSNEEALFRWTAILFTQLSLLFDTLCLGIR
jgi:hypothetical protein